MYIGPNLNYVIYFTADTHFCHTNIINLSKRPFVPYNSKHMNQSLVTYWNEVISDNDIVYHLGDFGLGRRKDLQWILDSLNGEKHLILGNHDKRNGVQKLSGWQSISNYIELEHNKIKFVLFHYPIGSWNKMHRGSVHLHGHSHGSYKLTRGRMMDVGVDCNDYRPISIEYVCNKLIKKEIYKSDEVNR